ncbi:DUF7266 family protein [Halorubellus salinus]|uniref:DUF7266 family protein n=1 Tax=Halorubellus salinus TaxID=755309 RepID=UPI001D073592|nr:hypothetical protein [Halorubellus salinus]
MIRDSFFTDDRAVSIAVTHVLTIGITTILITGLLVGGSGLLRDEKERATQTELRTIGNRMASEISSAYYSAEDAGGGTMAVRVSHPQYVAGDNYNVELRDGDANCDAPGDLAPTPSEVQCLVLSTPGGGESEIVVPIDPSITLKDPPTTVSGGSFYIVIEESGGTMELTIQNDRPSPSLAPSGVTW